MARRNAGVLALFLAAGLGLTGCGEDLEAGGTCPILCPEQDIVVRDTVLTGVIEQDTTVEGYPPLGSEAFLLLASRGDSLQTVAVVRYDVLPTTFRRSGEDSAITRADSSALRLRIASTGRVVPGPVTIEVYDVFDSTIADTSSAATLALFTPSRLVATRTFTAAEIADPLRQDSLMVPIPDSLVLARVTAEAPLRFGLRLSAEGSAQLLVRSRESGLPVELQFDPSPDTLVRPRLVLPTSRTPADQPVLAHEMADYTLVVRGTPPPPPQILAVGGVPARRTYLRFDLPRRIVDSTTIVRATLTLTQRPSTGLDATDTLRILPHMVIAGTEVVDVAKAALLVLPFRAVPGLDALRTVPADSGRRTFELAGLLERFGTQDRTRTPHALVLRTESEGILPAEAQFYSSEAPAALRPVLRISFVSRASIGLP